MKRFLTHILFMLLPLAALAGGELPSDSLRASLLTCSPGEEAYALYGHTALRLQNVRTEEDYTFNYGVFSFGAPGFVWRFVLGETDYTIEAELTDAFLSRYAAHGRSVTEQRLDLRQDEIIRLLRALAADANTPGWTYRYNFLGDNCTSRAVRMVEEATGGTLVLPATAERRTTFRDIIHGCASDAAPWNAFGQDLLLGSDVDTLLSARAELAFPLRAEALLDEARMRRPDGSERKLVSTKQLLTAETAPLTAEGIGHYATPSLAALLLLLVAAAVSRRQLGGKPTAAHVFDCTAMAVQGMAGCIVFVLFFSEHPAVGSNWLILFLNPLPLLWLPIKAVRLHRKRRDRYVTHVQPLLLAGLAAAHVVQRVPTALTIVALSLLVRTIAEWALSLRRRA